MSTSTSYLLSTKMTICSVAAVIRNQPCWQIVAIATMHDEKYGHSSSNPDGRDRAGPCCTALPCPLHKGSGCRRLVAGCHLPSSCGRPPPPAWPLWLPAGCTRGCTTASRQPSLPLVDQLRLLCTRGTLVF